MPGGSRTDDQRRVVPVGVKPPIGPLIVCTAAASFAAGALLFADDSPRSPATVPAADAAAPVPGTTSPTLVIEGFAFGSVTVERGATVTVVNRDAMQHTVTGAGFDTGVIEAGGTAPSSPRLAPGTYTFSCGIHPSMTGTLTVV